MHSIRSKITLMTVSAVMVAMVVAALLGVLAIRSIGNRSANQTLYLLCEAGERNLDFYFETVEHSVKMISAYVESDLHSLEEEDLQAHLDRVSEIFHKLSYQTNGILTYYYRIDPAISKTVKGFWYVNQDGSGFREHEVTDITQYNTEDTSQLVWFTVPKATGKPIWLPPYITDNLDARVISYNVPVFLDDQFVGVIGIEMDYSAMAEQVNNITLYENGYAFLNDDQGSLIYHPHIDVTQTDQLPEVPSGLLSQDAHVRYSFQGVEKQAVWLPLTNGMRLNVTVPTAEINADWQKWAVEIVVIFAAMLLVILLLVFRFSARITTPLLALTQVAEQVDAGNYECTLEYDGQDEVGILTRTFNRLVSNLKAHISDLNDLAYADALTSLHNKGAFDACLQTLQRKIRHPGEEPSFAVCIFDCNGLKRINDQHGHDKGDLFLKATANTICKVFDQSPVFRTGGDEFAAVLMNEDYTNRDALLLLFDQRCAESRTPLSQVWEQVNVARGIAVYDPREDNSVDDVVRRADQLMYEDKRLKNRSDALV